MGYLFALFVNAGMIKGLFRDYCVFDLTVVTFMIILITLTFEIVIGKRKVRNVFRGSGPLVIGAFYLFVIFILLSAVYTESPLYWRDKLFRIIFLTVPSFLIPCFFFKLSDIKNFIVGSIIIYCIVIVSLLHLLSIYGANLFSMWVEAGLDYLAWGGFIAYNSLLFACLLLDKKLRKRKMFIKSEWLALFLSLVSLFVIFLLGARGPFIFFLGVFFGMLLINKCWKMLIPITLCVLFLMAICLSLPNFSTDKLSIRWSSRILNLSIEATSVQARLGYFNESWNLIKERPVFGYGIGSFSYMTDRGDNRGYPHNIFLEIWLENGLIAVIMFPIFLFLIMYVAIKKVNKPFVSSFLCVNIYFMLSLMKSSSLTDARVFFAYLGILFAATWFSQSEFSGCLKTGSAYVPEHFLKAKLANQGLIKKIIFIER
ncbi:MAG: hypothetical protein DRI74_05910 [Bacteroidetes bacterium]|nr:MAG: hypothetical protein DRI74_05910 [Bacteroidota bacterium]